MNPFKSMYRRARSRWQREWQLIPTVELDDIIGAAPTIPLLLRGVDQDRACGPSWDIVALATIVHLSKAKRIFEIGTGFGRGTLNLAANSPPDACVWTIDLAEHPRTGVAFHGTPEAAKITQLIGDSTEFNFGPWIGSCDLVFVDGGHDYRTVAADSRAALRLITEAGTVVWDDFQHEWPGVRRALLELAATIPMERIPGTKIAISRRQKICPRMQITG